MVDMMMNQEEWSVVRFLRLCRIPTASTIAPGCAASVRLLLPVLLLHSAVLSAAAVAVCATSSAAVGLRLNVVECVPTFVRPFEGFVSSFVRLSESLAQRRSAAAYVAP